ncbi:MAG: divergent polysaccharide deacetylase family protein [Deltaproteobacteria bacterium]|nr:divergent polysaccharide deacetylase family protein [Deltaproteobacteria bacterium]
MSIYRKLFFLFCIVLSFLIIKTGYTEYKTKDKTEANILKRNGFLYYFGLKKTEKKTDFKKPKLAIIIDDTGYSFKEAEKFFGLDKAITYAILPFTPYAKKIAEYAHNKGIEIMLHLPMEPNEYPDKNPGKNALLSSMGYEEFEEVLNKNIKAVPYIKGVNNHMGSKLTTMPYYMDRLFLLLQKKKLYFIDSKTAKKSVTRQEASFFKIPFEENNLFIDNVRSYNAIKKQIERLVKIAKKEGKAIGIGHLNGDLYRVLKKELPKIKSEVTLVSVSELF